MENCPACIGPNPDCATCHGEGTVSGEVLAAFVARAEAQRELFELRHAVDEAFAQATSLTEAKEALAALI